jgi:hypothetical protein
LRHAICIRYNLPWDRRVSFEFLPLPVVGLKIETPQPDDLGSIFVVDASEEIHHVIVDDGGVCENIAEGIVVEEVGESFGPYFSLCVVSVYRPLFVVVVFRLLSGQTSVNID